MAAAIILLAITGLVTMTMCEFSRACGPVPEKHHARFVSSKAATRQPTRSAPTLNWPAARAIEHRPTEADP